MGDKLNDGPRLALWCALHPDDAAAEIERLRSDRKILDKRIHNQRQQLRETWEIVEKRRKWLGSQTARQAYLWLLKRYKALQEEHAAAKRS